VVKDQAAGRGSRRGISLEALTRTAFHFGKNLSNYKSTFFILFISRYILHEPFIGNTGPSLGALSVYTKVIEADGNVIKKPIWKLYNHQGPEWRYAQALIQEEKAFTVMQLLVKSH
jgi:hypothetical protein